MLNILRIKKGVLLAGDTLLLILSLPAMLIISFREDFNFQIFVDHLFPFLFIYLFILILFYIGGLYDARSFKNSTYSFAAILMFHAAGGIFGVLLFYLSSPEITPKTNLMLNMAIAAALVIIWRGVFQRFLAQHIKINVAIAGNNEHARELAHVISQQPYMGYNLSALINTNSDSLFTDHEHARVKTFFADKNLVKNLRAASIDTVITAENPHLNPALAQAFYECIPYKIRFLDLAQSYELLTGRIPVSYINQTWFLENINEAHKQLYASVKRFIDIIAAFAILILSLPFWIVIAFAIKWESAGPIFYSQERVGENKKLFKLTKFRSMIHNAEQGRAIWAQAKDPRITKIGSFLRRTHLDELPQMINIIKGDISLVGPRPERIEFVQELEKQIPHYNIRHIIKPGFTGWAQVNFGYARTPTDTYEKFQYDLYYLKNRSLILDIATMLKTVNLIFKKDS